MKEPNLHFKRTVHVTVILLLISRFGLLATAKAVSPPPDGGYPNGNTAEGQNAMFSLTSGGYNTAVGFFSLRSDRTGSFNTAIGAGTLLADTADENTATGAGALLSNNSGAFNTANGAFALVTNTTGTDDTAVGSAALESNTTGVENTAVGSLALTSNTASYDTAVGFTALAANTTGQNNSAFGWGALSANTTADYNTACGFAALYSNTEGTLNTAIGDGALYSNTTGSYNTATGTDALYSNTDGGLNTTIGYQALYSNNGSSNTAVGYQALYSNTDGLANTAVGFSALHYSTAVGSTAVGYNAGSGVTTAENVICIGQLPGTNVSNSCFIDNIWNQPGGSQAVYVNSDGKLGYQVSSRRFKDEIKPIEQASEVIYSLKPVSFRYKREIEPSRALGFGLIAEEVEKVSPSLVTRGGDGQVNSVRYDGVNAMLLNEFLKEHHQVQTLQATVLQQQKQIEALTSGLQKVSASMELSKGAPKLVKNKTD